MSTTPDIEAHQVPLVAVGYRLTGSRSDAEDAVQDAWLRLRRLPEDEQNTIGDPRAWLTTAVVRLCLDRLHSATPRRESYVGPWLPEPLLSMPAADDDPLAVVVRAVDVRMAAMVPLERLAAPQRVAFVLHETLGWDFADIAELLGCSVEDALGHASLARRAVAEAPPPPPSDRAEQRRMLAALADTVMRADTAALVPLLAPDVVMVNDSGGVVPAPRRVVEGVEKVSRLLIGLATRHGTGWLAGAIPMMVNGELGYWTPAVGGAPESVTVFSVDGGRATGCYSMLNPAKLSRVPGMPRRG